MAALYLERYLNFGLTLAELHSNRPIIGIAQTGSDLVALQPPPPRAREPRARRHPRRRRHPDRVPGPSRSRKPASGRRRRSTATSPISAWSRCLYGYSFDGVVLTTGCDKTTPAMIMGAGHGQHPGHRAVGRADARRPLRRRARGLGHGRLARAPGAGRGRDRPADSSWTWLRLERAQRRPLQHHGHRALDEQHGRGARHVAAPAARPFPGPYRERGQMAYETGKRIVDMVWEDLKPSDILTRKAFENAIVAASALGASTNCPPHVNAIARHIGVKLDNADWDKIGLRHPAAGELHAGRQVSRRGVPSRRRRADGDARAARPGRRSTAMRSP